MNYKSKEAPCHDAIQKAEINGPRIYAGFMPKERGYLNRPIVDRVNAIIMLDFIWHEFLLKTTFQTFFYLRLQASGRKR